MNHDVIFPTYLSQRQYDDRRALNKALRRIVLKKYNDADGITRSNVGGWHSGYDLLEWDHPEIADLKAMMGECITEALEVFGCPPKSRVQMNLHAWAMLYHDRHYGTPHIHPGSHVSGVYYVCREKSDADAPKTAGMIEFSEPRGGAGMLTCNHLQMNVKAMLDPIPGQMILFPSWLRHHVHPIQGTGERICIPFNARIDKITPPAQS